MTTRLEAYLALLPDGVGSYPTYVQKASVFRTFLAHLGGRTLDATRLPAPVRELVEAPPPPSAWVSEVHVTALFIAVREQCFASDAAYEQHWLEVNRAILSSPLYRMLMMVASPSQVVMGAARKWNQLHKGVTMRATLDGNRATVRLAFPENLLEPFVTRTYSTAFQAAIELSGGKNAVCALREYEPTLAVFDGHWD